MDSLRNFSLKQKKSRSVVADMNSESPTTRSPPPKSSPSTPGTLINSPFDPTSPSPAGPSSSYFGRESSISRAPPPSTSSNQQASTGQLASSSTTPSVTPVTPSKSKNSVEKASYVAAPSTPSAGHSSEASTPVVASSSKDILSPKLEASRPPLFASSSLSSVLVAEKIAKKQAVESTREPNKSAKMSAVSAIVNPLTVSGTRKILLYSTSELPAPANSDNVKAASTAFGVKLEQRYFDVHTTSYPVGILGVANIGHPSNLTTFLLDDMIHVFGVSTDGKSSTGRLELVSPAINITLGGSSADTSYSELENGTLAGCSNGRDQGWLYSIGIDGANGNARYISEFMVSPGGEMYSGKLNAEKVLDGTQLAAFYDGSDRYIVYQQTGGAIIIRNCDSDDEFNVTKSEAQSPLKTPLGAVFVRGLHGKKDRVYVYFVDAKRKLVCSFSEAGNFLSFNKPMEVEKHRGTIDSSSQISVITDSASQTNIIYAYKDLTPKYISAIVHKWEREAEHPKDCPGYPPVQWPGYTDGHHRHHSGGYYRTDGLVLLPSGPGHHHQPGYTVAQGYHGHHGHLAGSIPPGFTDGHGHAEFHHENQPWMR